MVGISDSSCTYQGLVTPRYYSSHFNWVMNLNIDLVFISTFGDERMLLTVVCTK